MWKFNQATHCWEKPPFVIRQEGDKFILIAKYNNIQDQQAAGNGIVGLPSQEWVLSQHPQVRHAKRAAKHFASLFKQWKVSVPPVTLELVPKPKSNPQSPEEIEKEERRIRDEILKKAWS
jgi:hypothetical protein